MNNNVRERLMSSGAFDFNTLYQEVDSKLEKLQNMNNVLQQNMDIDEAKDDFYNLIKQQQEDVQEFIVDIKIQMASLERSARGIDGKNKVKRLKDLYLKEILRNQTIYRAINARSSFHSEISDHSLGIPQANQQRPPQSQDGVIIENPQIVQQIALQINNPQDSHTEEDAFQFNRAEPSEAQDFKPAGNQVYASERNKQGSVSEPQLQPQRVSANPMNPEHVKYINYGIIAVVTLIVAGFVLGLVYYLKD